MEDLTPGLELGARFVLVRRLGRGGSAEVWLAVDRERGERVALKILDDTLAGDAPRMRALEAEVARSRTLPPSLAVALHGLHQAEGRTFLAMDYCEGGDLGQMRGRSFESWARPAREAAAALGALHHAGLVHRDLKCANVMLDAEGRARLADFGLTALAGSRPDGGSPYNASPQQLRGEPAQPSDDLYAFGALLYELIAGIPPYYPDITRDRVLYEPVPPLVPRGVVPMSVRELALRLLAKSPADRPATAAEVESRLTAAAAADEDEIVQPMVPELRAWRSPPPPPRRRWLPAALTAAAIAGVAAIVLLQPNLVRRDSSIVREARQEAEQQAAKRRASAERQAATIAARAAAETARDAFMAAFESLDARAAARWATAAFAEARDAGKAAAQRYAVGDYAGAEAGWKGAAASLGALEKEIPAALAQAVEAGGRALAEGKTGAARESFGLALAIDPKHGPATAGLARADRLDQAFAVVDVALADERAGRLDQAEAGFRKALGLDGAAPGARQGLERLAAQRAGDAYAAVMSQGFRDLAAGSNDAAGASFRRALELRPGSREARDALAALEQGQRASALQLLETRARDAESEERWDEALAAWREAATLEPSLESAREGVTRVAPRAELQRRIEALNAEPTRLWDPAGRAEARQLIATAAAAGNPRRRLAAAAAELGRLAAAAESPVRLTLESDGVTQVAIYRVGQYGAFSTREVELLPGRYTVVGTRNGYRDVRREVVLPPGAAAAQVMVRCEEPI
jgi:eukaryotic-like serine/threonine-protein kinase